MSDLSNVGESVGGTRETGAARDIAWLAEGEIPRAAVTLLAGEPGSGKSFVACTLAASVSQVPDARVVIAHREPAERVHSRLLRAGAEINRIALLGVGGQGATGGFRVQGSGFSKQQVGQAFQPDAAADAGRSTDKSKIQNLKSKIGQGLEVLIAWLSGAASVSRADLIVVDDLESVVGSLLSAAELAEASARLDELARASGAAVLAVVRSATTTEGRVTARSLDRLMRAADVVWTVAADREMAGHRWLVPLKNNLAALPRGKTFQIVEGRVEWLKEAVVPDDVLTPGSRRSAERADRQTAGMWLVEALALNDIPSRLLYTQARQCGFSRNTILRAAHKMGLHSHKCAFDGCWKYSLRDVPREVVDAYRTHPKWFKDRREHSEGFRVGNRGQGTGDGDGFGIQDSGVSVPAAVVQASVAGPSSVEERSSAAGPSSVAGRSPDRLAECDRRSPETPDAGDPRSALPAGSGDPARTGGSPSKTAANAEESQESQESPCARIANHQSPATKYRPPCPESPAPSPQFGRADLPPNVPPEPELRDHLGRMTAKTIENWERWYHQWHREIREYNPRYHFNT